MDPNQINADNMKDVRSETSRPSGTKRQKDDINECNINFKKRKRRDL
jgi:hypothetical protein